MSNRSIIVKGAREHNLKGINVEIPRDKMVVFTGVSGSGKSSLAIDTICAEGQRRYLLSLSAYARSFLSDQLEKPAVDYIEGLSPTISIEQKAVSKNPRSIVATVTEVYDYLRLLFANIGTPHCPQCGDEITPKTSQEITTEILKIVKNGTKFKVLAPVVNGKKGTYEKLFKKLKKEGYSRVIIQDEAHEPIEHLLDETISLDKNKKHTIHVVVDRLVMKENNDEFRSRLANSIEISLQLSLGLVTIAIIDGEKRTYSEDFFCTECGISYEKLAPRSFSFNTPYGACVFCKGLGSVLAFDEEKVFPDTTISIYESGLRKVGGFGTIGSYSWKMIECVADHYKIDLDVPIRELPQEFWDKLMIGTGREKIEFDFEGDRDFEDEEDEDGKAQFSWHVKRPFEGVMKTLQRRYMQTGSESMRAYYEDFMTEYECNSCKGKRLKPISLAVTIRGKSIWDICEMPVGDAVQWFKSLKLNPRETKIATEVLKEIEARYSFLENVGLEYITLDRRAKTLSGGESQRIRLATQIGSNLVGVLYVLDEPTIGLHPRDKTKLINMLKELRNKGNTVLIVEHDEDVIREADFIVDIGPGAGVAGGNVVVAGPIEKVMKEPKSLTGQYLAGLKKIGVPTHRKINETEYIKIIGAKQNNLKNIDLKIPLGVLSCITGVSGAGKSSLIEYVLFTAVKDYLRGKAPKEGGNYTAIEGLENIDKLINIDQTPIGRTPKSVPATYTKLFDHIRDLFAMTEEAKIRGYKKGRFSFNVKGGRCEKCNGKGFNLIEMHFLPDVYVKCDVCKGSRYNEETLEVKFNDKNIHQVLEMTHIEALEFFKNHNKIRDIVETVVDVGLGYIALGQSSTTLSGGEAQRMKLSRELSKRSTGNTLYILDEPTTGLHFDDVRVLINVLQRIVEKGNTVLVIEHNLDVIKSADHIIDIGPEGGERGGYIVAEGTPEDIALNKKSYTGQYLKELLIAQGNGDKLVHLQKKSVKVNSKKKSTKSRKKSQKKSQKKSTS